MSKGHLNLICILLVNHFYISIVNPLNPDTFPERIYMTESGNQRTLMSLTSLRYNLKQGPSKKDLYN